MPNMPSYVCTHRSRPKIDGTVAGMPRTCTMMIWNSYEYTDNKWDGKRKAKPFRISVFVHNVAIVGLLQRTIAYDSNPCERAPTTSAHRHETTAQN